MSNLCIREFSMAITNYINSSNVPLEVKRLVVADILHQLDTATAAALQEEISRRNASEKEQKEVKQDAESV